MDKTTKKRKNSAGSQGREGNKKSSLNSVPPATSSPGVVMPETVSSTAPSGSHGETQTTYTCKVKSATENAREFPTFIAMAGLIVTPTGFSNAFQRDAICEKLHCMSAEVAMAYTNKTTHLLAAHANTTKVELAKMRNLAVVTIDWLEKIWNACQQNPYVHASLPEFKNEDCPTFFNLKFVFSQQYDLENRQFYEQLVTTHGGFIADSLKASILYFYICQTPEPNRIYKFAQLKEVPCVPLAWIIESISQNCLVKVADFEIRGNELETLGITFDVSDYGEDLHPRRQSLHNLLTCPTANATLDAGLSFPPPPGVYESMESSSNSTLVGGNILAYNDSGVDEINGGMEEEDDCNDSIFEQTVIEAMSGSRTENLRDSPTLTLAA